MCLSPRVSIDRSQELINPFVSETTESAWNCICICVTVVIDTIMAMSSIQHLELFTPKLAGGFPLQFEWHLVSKTLLSILADLNNSVVWMVSIRPLISKSFVSMRRLRLKAATLNRCQLYYIIKLPELIFSIKVLK